MSLPLDALRDLLGPGLIFLLLVGWLSRKAWKAARTERDLERERDEAGGMRQIDLPAAPPLGPRPVPAVDALHPLSGADLSQARAEHVAMVAALLQQGPPRPPVEIVWVRSFGPHAAWLERGLAGAQALQVVRIEAGAVVERWTFE